MLLETMDPKQRDILRECDRGLSTTLVNVDSSPLKRDFESQSQIVSYAQADA